ncbi:MAG TPA: nicotinamide riboside transporter PnuC [Candidatus Angelobacter sp.]|jgi:nicotinamide mononucleotide transporter|nr:nicotinamide riboside transporter PnuC [Candidatus Angelobacter sp.]
MDLHWADVSAYLAGNWQELVGFVTGAVCVWLLVKENIWNWPVGITNNIFYVIIFYHSGLFADAGLQFVYITISIYGWWNWLHGGRNHSELTVSRLSGAGWFGYLGMAAGATALLYWLLRRFTPSTVPFADGLTTALFLTAQYMMSRKLVENWWFWIVGDTLVIALYIYKHLYVTAGLYLIFLAMCIAGLMEWRARAGKQVQLAASAS